MKIFLSILNLLLGLLVWGWKTDLIPFKIEAIVATSVTLFYLWIVRPSLPRYIYNVLIDGCLFAPFLSHYLLTIFFNFF